MTQEILKRLDALAEKLGTTAAHLWAILVAQARVDAVQSLIWIGFWALTLVVAFIAAKLSYRAGQKDDDWFAMTGIAVFLIVVGIGVIANQLTNVATDLLNPEYYAFTKVMEQLH